MLRPNLKCICNFNIFIAKSPFDFQILSKANIIIHNKIREKSFLWWLECGSRTKNTGYVALPNNLKILLRKIHFQKLIFKLILALSPTTTVWPALLPPWHLTVKNFNIWSGLVTSLQKAEFKQPFFSTVNYIFLKVWT